MVAAESEERFRTLVLASSAIVWRADAEGTTAFEPGAWLAFTGLRLRDLKRGAEEWLEAVHADDRARVRAKWSAAVAASTTYVCEHRLRRKAGGYAWVVARAVPIVRDGVAREWIGMMSDITERIEIERAREQFMAVLSHDLRSPLAAISISADALQHLRLEAPYGVLVEEIKKTSKRMTELVQDVMDFARGRLGNGIPLSRKRCDLGEICAEIVAESLRIHPDRAISASTRGDLSGEWDRGRLAQMLTNLLDNAVTHGTDPILITLVGDDSEVVLTVANHGRAIPTAALGMIFEPFSHAQTGLHSKGLGLGLYIVSELIRAHRGTVTISSTDDLTTVAVRLPRV
ncbi:MAG: PAS domain-containing sensor histidine kinase [Deltaproteobacteria bacterium]|nr:PAS domain-containing sensor histidine kinase [Deltaproteobacteria bacterium]